MPDAITFNTDVRIQAAASDGGKSFRGIAYTGGIMQIAGFGPLVVDLTGLDIPPTVALRHDHGEGVLSVCGHGQARVDGGKLLVSGTLASDTDAGRHLVALSRSGFPLQLSIGARPIERTRIKPGETVQVNGRSLSSETGFTLVHKSELFEISVVDKGADQDTALSIAANAQKGTKAMSSDTTELIGQACDEIIADANIDGGKKWIQHIRAQAVSGEIDVDTFQQRIIRAAQADRELEELRASRPMGPTVRAGRGGTNGKAIQAALFKHLGQETIGEKVLGADTMEAGAAIRATHFLDIVKAALTQAGRDIPASRDNMIRAAFSTTDLAGMLGNTANKLLLDAYRAVPSVARIVAKKLSARDFKTATGYRLTGDSKFQHVPAGGEIKHGTLSESSYPYKVDTYGRFFGITRQDIINDDLGAFNTIPMVIGRGAAVALEELFWKLVLANTSSFFGGDNDNYIDGAGSALSIASLSSAVTKIRKQVDTEGTSIMVSPKYLVVPPELETTADALHTSTNIALAGTTDIEKPDGNPHKGKYQPMPVPHLSNENYSGNSTVGWYLFGIPDDVAAFGVAYLNGVESPTVESQDAPFNTLGLQFRGYLDFGVCQVDHRGGVMSKGS